MKFLTKRIGPFPSGIWIVLVFLLISGLVLLLFAQALSFFAWDAAFSLGLQEDSRNSTDLVERTIGAMSWGEAGVVPDLSRAKLVRPLMVALWGISGVISLICLIANRDFFDSGKSD